MAHVRRILEDNYMFDLSLDSVGEILHISPAYLSAQFKKYQKMNFLDCLTELRINAAKELLTDPFRSSAEVASMVGYEDASYFARAFKKRTGMTPTQYRRQAGQKRSLHGGPALSGRRISRRSVLALAACTALGAVGCGRAVQDEPARAAYPALCGEPAGGLSHHAGGAGLCRSCGPADGWPGESRGVQRRRAGGRAERHRADAVRRH